MIIDKEMFWKEVSLIAQNNYGNWSDEEQARSFVVDAINEVFNNLMVDYSSDFEEIEPIVKEMQEANND